MQKFKEKLKNSPTDAPQVCSFESPGLNKVQRPSVQDKALSLNSPDVDQPHHREGKKLSCMVYVISSKGNPLMPTIPCKAKHMLKKGKAIVVKRSPFVIKLVNDLKKERVQDITLGIDPGYKKIGFSAISDKKELICGEVELDNMMSKRLQNKAMYRRARRGRLWHRKPRFLNRVSSKKKGWLAPSVKRRLETHLRIVEKIKQILPITKVIVEIANFDIQKIKNPDIKGVGYQQGDLLGYNNVRSYLIARENSRCQLCGEEKGFDKWRVHHINQRKNVGSNAVSNLALLHEKCHIKLHKQNLGHKLKKNKQYKDAAFMNIIRWKLKELLDSTITFGHITHKKLLDLNLPKTHYNDAFVIAGGDDQNRCLIYDIEQKRRNNRCLQKNRKGFKPAIRKQRYKIQPQDLVRINNNIYDVIGIYGYGKNIRLKDKIKKFIDFSVKKVDWHFMQKSFVWKLSNGKRALIRLAN